nr:Crp/Fnr family transcriptional regulator [uncultured Niameybacter sp.]
MACHVCVGKFCAYKIPILSHLDCDELEEVLKLLEHKEYAKGEILFQEGDVAKTLYILNEGRLKLYKYTKEGKEQILHILKEGDFLGELQLLKPTQFENSAKAITDCNVCTLKKEDFQKLLLKRPEIALKVLEVIGERLVRLENLALILADNDSDAKLAYLLLELGNEYGTLENNKLMITLPISKEEMANYAGLTRETISRKLKSFSDMGLIKMIGHKKIEILNKSALKDLL